MWRVLFGEIEGICIICVKLEKILYEYFIIIGIEELVYEILMNLKEIVLRSNLYGIWDVFICFKGFGYVIV